MLEAEKKFHRIRGFKHVHRLEEALKNYEKKLGYGARIDAVKQTG